MALIIVHAFVVGVLTLIVIQTLLNRARLPRLAEMPVRARPPRIAVLIPARNEEAIIGACVARWAGQAYPDYEIVVYDDDSTDATAARAAAVGETHVRVIRGGPLPAGWRGKPHACHRLRERVRADLLVFADADVLATPDTLARVAGAFERLGVDAMSALPAHTSPSLVVRALVPIQNWAPLAFAPLWLPAARRRPAFTVMNGQFIAIRAAAYDRCGGFAAVRGSLGEDAMLGRRLVRLGHAVAVVDGTGHLACRPYTGLRALWVGNARNLVVALLGSQPLLVAAATALAALYLGPPALLGSGLASGRAATVAWTWLPLAELALGMLSRLLTDRAAGYARWLALLHPLAVAALVGMSFDSAARGLGRGAVEWRGRRYNVSDVA